MADIDIVPKQKSSSMTWVILALIVIALIVWFAMR